MNALRVGAFHAGGTEAACGGHAVGGKKKLVDIKPLRRLTQRPADGAVGSAPDRPAEQNEMRAACKHRVGGDLQIVRDDGQIGDAGKERGQGIGGRAGIQRDDVARLDEAERSARDAEHRVRAAVRALLRKLRSGGVGAADGAAVRPLQKSAACKL